ncbi:protein asteroid homolog 1-like [Artemia franciscana]|uniref:protein asteroid homolog 1-like n=1 Tax=Artemia franciscana TaxID=6661 RepID=UPI0032DB2D84
MVIRGLFSYIEKQGDKFLKDHELTSTTVIVDVNNVAVTIHNSSYDMDPAFGGNYDKLFAEYCDFNSLLKQCNITPIMVLNGALGVDNRNRNKKMKNRHDRLRKSTKCFPGNQYQNEVFPLFGVEVFINACKMFNFKVIQNDFEADEETALFAKSLHYPVLSNDSDYLIFGVKQIPLKSLNLGKGMMARYNEKGKHSSSLKCKIFLADKFVDYLSLPSTHLPYLGVLLGNGLIDFKSLTNPHDTQKNFNIQSRIDVAASWLRQHKIDDVHVKILSLVEEEKKEDLKKLLAYYGKTEGKPTALEYFFKGSGKEIIINSKGNRALPQWFMTASREAMFPPWILRIVCAQEFFYFAQVEELKEPYSVLPAMDIVKGLSAVLLSHDYRNISLESTNVKVAHLAVQFRSGATIEERNIPFYEGQCVTIPNLEDIPLLPSGTKERFFNQVMKLNDFQSRTIKQFPKDIQMFIGSMIFWNNETNPSSHQVDALIMMLVVQRSVGKYGHRQNQASDSFSGIEGDPNNTIKNLWNRLDKSDCDLAIKILEDRGCTQKSIAKPKYKVSRYDNAAKSSNACKYYKRTVHKYAEFQMILYFVTYMNRLLGCPYPETNSVLCFNGFFLHNLASYIFSNSNWIETFSTCKSVYRLLKQVVLTFSSLTKGQCKQDNSNETLRNLDDMLMRLKV